MTSASEIFTHFSEEMRSVDRHLMEIFGSNVFVIPMIGRHILSSGGKRIRPLFLLMSADLCGYNGHDRALLGAIIEAIHTASLLHDDVIDGAEQRRGKAAAHSIWGNQIVILVGDFLYSNALKIAVAQRNQKVMETLSEATTRMTEGEILQLNKIGDPDITTEEYFQIISSKTGVLLSAACRIAAILAGQPEEVEEALGRFGMKTGIAFQLADDILDYVAAQKDLGKRIGKDLEEGKITMPLIHLLNAASEAEQAEVRQIIQETVAVETGEVGGDNGKGGFSRITELFSKYRTIEESLKTARDLISEAKAELSVFPDSEHKQTILAMADYVMNREK